MMLHLYALAVLAIWAVVFVGGGGLGRLIDALTDAATAVRTAIRSLAERSEGDHD